MVTRKQHFDDVEKETNPFPLLQKDLAEFPRELCLGNSHDITASKRHRRRSSWHSCSSSSSLYTSDDDDDDDIVIKRASFDQRRQSKIMNDIYRRSIELLHADDNGNNRRGEDDVDNQQEHKGARTATRSTSPASRRSAGQVLDDLDDVSPKMAKMMASALSKASFQGVIQQQLQRNQTLDKLATEEPVHQSLRSSNRGHRKSSNTERQMASVDISADLEQNQSIINDSPIRKLLPIKSSVLRISPSSSAGSKGRKGRMSPSPRGGKPVRRVDSLLLDPPLEGRAISRSQSPLPLRRQSTENKTTSGPVRNFSPIKSKSLCVPLASPLSASPGGGKRPLPRNVRRSLSSLEFAVMGDNSDDDEEAVRLAFVALAQQSDETSSSKDTASLLPELMFTKSDCHNEPPSSRKRSPFGRGRRGTRSPERNEKERNEKKWNKRLSPFRSSKTKSEDACKSEDEAETPEKFQPNVSEHCMPRDQVEDGIYHYTITEGEGISCLQLTCAGSVAECSFAPLGTVA